MIPTNETLERYALLEEIITIPEPIGFSIPRLRVAETLTHKGRTYTFYYEERRHPFLTFVYDAHQKSVTSAKISAERLIEMQADPERIRAILDAITQKILEKNHYLYPVHSEEFEGFLTETKRLSKCTDRLAEEIAVLENKEEVKKTLVHIQAQIEGIQQLIEQQKVTKLKEALSLVD